MRNLKRRKIAIFSSRVKSVSGSRRQPGGRRSAGNQRERGRGAEPRGRGRRRPLPGEFHARVGQTAHDRHQVQRRAGAGLSVRVLRVGHKQGQPDAAQPGVGAGQRDGQVPHRRRWQRQRRAGRVGARPGLRVAGQSHRQRAQWLQRRVHPKGGGRPLGHGRVQRPPGRRHALHRQGVRPQKGLRRIPAQRLGRQESPVYRFDFNASSLLPHPALLYLVEMLECEGRAF